MTPAEHRIAAAQMLEQDEHFLMDRNFLDIALAHAELSRAAGTGLHYDMADRALTAAENLRRSGRQQVSAAKTAAGARILAALAERA